MNDPSRLLDFTGAVPVASTAIRTRWATAGSHAAHDRDAWAIHPTGGDPALRAELAELLACDVDDVSISGGVRSVAAILGGVSTRVAVETPTFERVPTILRAAGAEVRTASWPQLRHSSDPVVWITSPFRNPDGARHHDGAKWGDDQLVIVNETYRWFAPAAMEPPAAPAVGGFSKMLGGGVRLGWVRGRQLADRLEPMLAACSPASILQRQLAHFLHAGGLDLVRAEVIEPALDAARTFAERAQSVSQPCDPPSPHLLLVAAGDTTESELLDGLSSRGITASPGSAFDSAAPACRVSFLSRTAAEASVLADAVDELTDAGVIAGLTPAVRQGG